jgi:ParB family transcriptional regulator, chromosome partitioning protein
MHAKESLLMAKPVDSPQPHRENSEPSDQNLLPIEMIPISQIRVTNPRSRDQKKFNRMVDNISTLGLKRPIRVVRSRAADGSVVYDLSCGQGRVEAFIALGQTEIPAQIGNDDKEQQLLLSLAENIARRQPLRFDHIRHIKSLKDRGYNDKQIAEKIGLSDCYVTSLLNLWENGEERLLRAVETGAIPVSMAVEIARASDEEGQKILMAAYESKKLRGKPLIRARNILHLRRSFGKKATPLPSRRKKPTSADALARTYQEEVRKQRRLSKQSKLCESRMLFVTSAMKRLLTDEHFLTLLRAEKLDNMPRYLAAQAGFKIKEQICIVKGAPEHAKQSQDLL